MFSSGIKLCTSADFDNAIFFGVNVIVWQDRQIIGYGAKITKHSDDSVYINEDIT
jgi:hypothetical protein